TVLEAHVRESYDLRGGDHIVANDSHQDLFTYQHSPNPTAEPAAAASLGGWFRVVPSRSFGFAELLEGRIAVDLTVPQAGEAPGLVDAPGGHVDGPGGIHLDVPANAVNAPTVI